MRLPHADQARVDREKILEYLLSPSHPDGSHKAEFFTRYGFHLENWEVLQEALRTHGTRHPVVKTVESTHGTRYAVDGALVTTDGRDPMVRTVWLIGKGSTIPRLITAYPIR